MQIETTLKCQYALTQMARQTDKQKPHKQNKTKSKNINGDTEKLKLSYTADGSVN